MENKTKSQCVPEKILKESVLFLNAWDTGTKIEETVKENSETSDFRKTVLSLIYSCFRNRAFLEYLIAKFARRAEGELKNILLSVLTQCLYQTGIPREIAAYVAVDFTKKRHGRGAAGFVNAVLRKSLSLDIANFEKSAPVNVRYRLPKDLYETWSRKWNYQKLAEFAELLGKKPNLLFRFLKPVNDEEFKKSMCRRISLPGWSDGFDFYETPEAEQIVKSGWLKEGKIYISDPSTVLAPNMLAENNPGIVLDMCSAPGGKSLALAQKLPENSLIVSADSSFKRQKISFANFASSGFSEKILTVAASASAPPFKEGIFESVLLDAPCSNTGVFRHKPDVLWHYNRNKIKELTNLQRKMLGSAAGLLKTGGFLCYSTCSIEEEENSLQINSFLAANRDFKLVKEQLLSPCGFYDGAYAALLRRN